MVGVAPFVREGEGEDVILLVVVVVVVDAFFFKGLPPKPASPLLLAASFAKDEGDLVGDLVMFTSRDPRARRLVGVACMVTSNIEKE